MASAPVRRATLPRAQWASTEGHVPAAHLGNVYRVLSSQLMPFSVREGARLIRIVALGNAPPDFIEAVVPASAVLLIAVQWGNTVEHARSLLMVRVYLAHSGLRTPSTLLQASHMIKITATGYALMAFSKLADHVSQSQLLFLHQLQLQLQHLP